MAWTAIDGAQAWKQVYSKYIQAIDGPQLESVRSKATRAIVNKWQIFVQQNLANSYGRLKIGASALASAASFVIPEAASSLVKKLPTAINAALDLGLGLGKASALDKEIGTIDAAKEQRREALARQLLDSRASTLFAEMFELKVELARIDAERLDKIASCSDLDRTLKMTARARLLNNRLAQHMAYMEGLTAKLRDLTASAKMALDKWEQGLDDIGGKAFADPDWHANHCSADKLCLFDWDLLRIADHRNPAGPQPQIVHPFERRPPGPGAPPPLPPKPGGLAGPQARPSALPPRQAPPLPPKPKP